MRRLPLTIAIALAALTAAIAPAAAHELQVLEPGPAEVDAGTAAPPRLVHATLLDDDDRLEVAVTPSAGPVEALLLVPDRLPERDRTGDAAPEVDVDAPDDVRTVVPDQPEQVVDEVTGFGYLVLARITLPEAGQPATITVSRGSEPTRVALRLGPPGTPFASAGADRTPRALLLARTWLDTEPAGASDLPEPDRTAPDRTVAWLGLAIALVGVLIAVWWVARGRSTSRRRGIERADAERSAVE